ncbi:TetR/AcrR family transcriptional regulator [Sphingomonas sp. PR090111-T3T-6A]|uniref:TetR/AcrR family transcriptional regulator n=1 Tax=Sphingomonas sp. PR090111-T3T-6A TaxID=685778 RepID=UPI00047741D1|nr:TetR/AcrR family transcriptional regulator [Sphingomonas sp. PR090111-T3T-6A]
MATIKNRSPGIPVRGEPLRQTVLDAAETLLREGKADFSMRDLAAQAGVSFATPFNQFGSKAAIMRALSGRRIDTMAKRFAEAPTLPGAAERVLLATAIAVEVMLEQPDVNRTVMGWIGAAAPSSGQVRAHSSALWAVALGAGEGLLAFRRDQALSTLPAQLAFGFRGVLSFWTAGELSDKALALNARDVASTLLLAFAEP